MFNAKQNYILTYINGDTHHTPPTHKFCIWEQNSVSADTQILYLMMYSFVSNQNESLTDWNTVSGYLVELFVGTKQIHNVYLTKTVWQSKVYVTLLFCLKADIRTSFEKLISLTDFLKQKRNPNSMKIH